MGLLPISHKFQFTSHRSPFLGLHNRAATVLPSRERPVWVAGSTGQRNTLIFFQGWSVDMKQRRRIYYSAAQRSEIWDRWQAGEPMSAIGRRFDRESSSVFSVISPTGGIRPPDRRRSAEK
jgi:hypothetical protein